MNINEPPTISMRPVNGGSPLVSQMPPMNAPNASDAASTPTSVGGNLEHLAADRRDQSGIRKPQQVHRDGDRQHAGDGDVAAGERDALGEIARHLTDHEPPALLMVTAHRA